MATYGAPQGDVVVVSDEERSVWLHLSHEIRTLAHVVESVAGEEVSSELATDDAKFSPEPESAWVRSYLASACEHLGQWADLAIPRHACDQLEFSMLHFKPQLMLGRAGLECAAQALWVLSPEDESSRLIRHMRLMLVDSYEERKLPAGSARIDELNELEAEISAYANAMSPGSSLKHISYLKMIREAAAVIGQVPDSWEHLWHRSSAAAHGKKWLSRYAYDLEAGLDGEQRRDWLAPRPLEISEVVGAAVEALHGAVLLYCKRAGINPQPLWRPAALHAWTLVPARPEFESEKETLIALMRAHIEAAANLGADTPAMSLMMGDDVAVIPYQ
ncbi:hypothetical protein [Arthrobacter sp. UYCo732]|uniref:hypothetical protein n=1 Tax=Arthrobacter sp. UYCo732 TaxID=3156336 RepID=UPI003394C232